MKLIREKVYCPTIVDTFRRDLIKFAMGCADISSRPFGAQLQIIQAIQAMYTLLAK
jgi:hypothetical protein